MIRYFDLGVHTGEQIDLMLKVLPEFGEFEIYGIEACKEHYNKSKEKYKKYNNIHLYNFAINDYDGTCELYYATCPDGHSIYNTKYDIIGYMVPVPVPNNNMETVESIKFSTWIKSIPDLDKTFNVMKYNIEGAELNLFKDMDENNMFKSFGVIIGGYGLNDILKCKEIENQIDVFYDICDKNNIQKEHGVNWDLHIDTVLNELREKIRRKIS